MQGGIGGIGGIGGRGGIGGGLGGIGGGLGGIGGGIGGRGGPPQQGRARGFSSKALKILGAGAPVGFGEPGTGQGQGQGQTHTQSSSTLSTSTPTGPSSLLSSTQTPPSSLNTQIPSSTSSQSPSINPSSQSPSLNLNPNPTSLYPSTPTPDLILDPDDKSVKAGTPLALVERLTSHDTADPGFTKAFLMTFKSFMSLDELFEMLVGRYRMERPRGLAEGGLEMRMWEVKKRKVVRFRVINTFKSMLTDEDILEKEDLYILRRMKEFVLSEDVQDVGALKSLLMLIERVQQSGSTKRIVVKPTQTAPAPILPNGGKKLKLTDIDPLELARQLTLIESALYQKIRPMECLLRAREGGNTNNNNNNNNPGTGMDNIAYVIQTSNRIADWVAESVLSKEDSRKRAGVVKHLILVADRCRTLNNFSSMIAIVSGLNTPPIRRLKRTWELVSQRHMAQFGACEVTLDSNRNFNKYRSMLASVVPPCVPFIGVFLSTLQFIQDGNKDMVPSPYPPSSSSSSSSSSPLLLVNFKKRQMASEVISDIKRWQAHEYNLQVVPGIREFIEDALGRYAPGNPSSTGTGSDRFWQMSLEREPREREDEKMARLLQESGFL
ncbi:ras guanine nucleotide exchange factor domain-containing protein [Lentinula raphanica]|nr:ras guanine nucleotide exchange factor domain-containing protein [Lentinula raphanica]